MSDMEMIAGGFVLGWLVATFIYLCTYLYDHDNA